MSLLLYCIYHSKAVAPPAECSGVFAIEAGELAAAASVLPDPPPAVDLEHLRTYEKVVAALHASRTIIPLRYGCIVRDRSQAVDLLEQAREDCRRMLEELKGRVEMGLRLLRDGRAEASRADSAGRCYLECARHRQGGLTAAEERWTERLCGELSGLYARKKKEARSSSGARVVSLYFLIPADGLDEFRQRVRRLALAPDMKMLVSGPWPPYTFANDASERNDSDRDRGAALCALV